MSIRWEAYCKTCGKVTDDAQIPNGSIVEAIAKHHILGNPDHEVIVGYEMNTSKEKVDASN